MYCDICEVFDRHDTEDCEKQDVEEVCVRQKASKTPQPHRDYCVNCEVFGHDTFTCANHQNKKKKDYTFWRASVSILFVEFVSRDLLLGF